jgi:hypothetical protein
MDDQLRDRPDAEARAVADGLRARVEGQFFEMPTLRLTLAQARRLWGLDQERCERVLRALVDAGFLALAHDGSFFLAPSVAAA